ncbi:hybrid sensor histidine kinase/response regulator [Limnothrix sp. FACHB-1083]|uniref:sensor histidine kinase n=1 Tax=unclassified Limnothrix TaxID=2632864 RepID=UPI0016801121|nr:MULTISPECIES: response regulator [unclassified Limnothrix]MBD2161026.1 hybrid sensor histidine kinase/response regulator [Limnothrix sp. FACHB-1083]MBD2191727.1 hybrid sensor histidine kinase/response regulator [Limnothrix sp. FACHB-1088]
MTDLVLIVDDTPTNLDVLSLTLSNSGFEVAIATSGERALQQVARCLPSLILLDVMMPGLDGFETCLRLKENPETAQVPVIFMTALTDIKSKMRGLEVGAVDYITKPFHTKEVLARIRTHLKLYRLTEKLAQEVENATTELRASQMQLVQSEKMSALGSLIAGVAHEINNPVGCILGNIQLAEDALGDLFKVIRGYQQELKEPSPELLKLLAQIDLDYLQEDLPKLLNSIKGSGERITTISRSLRTFSRMGSDRPQLFNVHDGIDSTLMILRHRLIYKKGRPVIEVVTDYGEIPDILCFPDQLNQVFMNILANAIDALDEMVSDWQETNPLPDVLKITIRTRVDGEFLSIKIGDNGKGIPEQIKPRIFEHLFTTKQIGKGTGLGLAIAHQIVTEKHLGTLTVESQVGQGTEFEIRLPTQPDVESEPA